LIESGNNKRKENCMADHEEIKKIVQIAWQYYEQKLTQQEIADSLGISRPTVAKLLKEAVKKNIVSIKIIDPFSVNSDLSLQLQDCLGLANCIVVPGKIDNNDLIRRNIALAAINYLYKVIKPGDIVGVGWGRTLYKISEYIEPHQIKDVILIPLLGGIGQVKQSLQVHNIIQKISESLECEWVQYHMPGVLDHKGLRNQLINNSETKNVIKYWGKLNKAVVGIGESPLSPDVIFKDTLSSYESEKLIMENAVGDICMRFYDRDGTPVDYIHHEVMSITLGELIKVPDVIAVAGGNQKVDAIIGASHAGYINVLITDENTAIRIIDKMST